MLKQVYFVSRPSIQTNDGGWTDVDWFRIANKIGKGKKLQLIIRLLWGT